MPVLRLLAAFVTHLRFFAGYVGYRIVVLVVLTLATTSSEGVAIALLLPLISGSGGFSSGIGAVVARLLAFLGIPATTEGVLGALVAFAILKGLLTFATVAWQHHIVAKLTQDLRRRLIAGLEEVDFRWILRSSAAQISVVISGETNVIASGFLAYSKLFPHAITAAAFLGIVAWVDTRFAVAIVLFGVFLTWAQTIPRRIARSLATELNAESIGMGSLMLQSLLHFKYLAATDTLDRVHRRLRGSIRRITVLNYRLGAAGAFAYSFPQPVVAIVLAGLLLWLSRLSGAGGVTTGFVVLVYLYRAMNEVASIQSQWQAFTASVPSIGAVKKLDADLRANKEKAGGVAPPPLDDAIRLEDVVFRYDDRDVLDRVSLTIPRRALVAFVGASGSGKTTLADLLSGLLKPVSGRITVDGVDLAEVDLKAWRRRIGYVPQEPAMFTATLAENVAFWSCDVSEPGCRRRVEEAGARALCSEFVRGMPKGWDEEAGERGNRLSGGQRQRIAIARELFKQPELLILDEATSALDAEAEQQFRATLEAMKGTVTTVVIAHRLSTVKACDRVFVFQAGRIVEEGGVDELLHREGSRFRDLAKLQSF